MERRGRTERGSRLFASDRGGSRVQQTIPPRPEGLGVALAEYFMAWLSERIEKLGHGGSDIGTGLPEIDLLLNGLNPGCVYLLSGRQEVGKTSFALNIVANRVIQGKSKVLLFSITSKRESLVERVVSLLSGLDKMTIRSTMMDDGVWGKFMAALQNIKHSDIEFDCEPELPLDVLRTKVFDYVERARGVDLIILDDAQLIGASIQNGLYCKIRPLTTIISDLYYLAKSHECAVLVIASSVREQDDGIGSRNTTLDSHGISDLAGNSSAAMVLHRARAPQKKSRQQLVSAEIEIVKLADGPCGTVKLQLELGTMRFSAIPR